MKMFSDSRLIVGQVEGELEARDLRMQEYLNQIRYLQSGFEYFNLSQIPRSRNIHLDSLATLATSSAQNLPQVILVENLCKPTKVGRNVVYIHQIRVSPSWMDSIMLLFKEDILLESKFEANKVWRKAPWFQLSDDQKLYKKSFSGPYLLYIHPNAIKLLIEKLHERICRSHTGGKSLFHKALTQGYQWANMQREA